MERDRTGNRELLPEPYSQEYVNQWLEKCPYDSIVHLVISLNALNEGRQPPEEHVIFLCPFLRRMLAEKWYERTIEHQLRIYFPESFKIKGHDAPRGIQELTSIDEDDYKGSKSNVQGSKLEQIKSEAEDVRTQAETESIVNKQSKREDLWNQDNRVLKSGGDIGNDTDVKQGVADDVDSHQQKEKKGYPSEDPLMQERTFLEWIEFLLSKHPIQKSLNQRQSSNNDQITQIKLMLDQLSHKKQGYKSRKTPIVSERLAMIYEQQGQWKEALEIYKALILQKPDKKDYFEKKIEKIKRKIGK